MTNGQMTEKIDHVCPDGFQITKIVNRVAYYPVQNIVGSNTMVKDSSGNPIFGANYYPWGKLSLTSGSRGRETL